MVTLLSIARISGKLTCTLAGHKKQKSEDSCHAKHQAFHEAVVLVWPCPLMFSSISFTVLFWKVCFTGSMVEKVDKGDKTCAQENDSNGTCVFAKNEIGRPSSLQCERAKVFLAFKNQGLKIT